VALAWLMVAAVALGNELDLLPLGDEGRRHRLAATPAGSFYDCRQDRELTLEELADALVQARVVLIGEDHTDIEQKRFHARLLQAMAARKADLVLGMEFFQRSDHDSLLRWAAGEIATETVPRRAGWYDRGGYRFEYYSPVMEVARARRIPVVGLNVSRDIPRAVNRGGLAGLSAEQRSAVGEVTTDHSPEHRYLISRYFGETPALMPSGWFENMYGAQCLWDTVMARSILNGLGRGTTMVVIVGSGHVAYGLGISLRIHDERAASGMPDIEVATFCPVLAPPPNPEGDPGGHPMGEGHGGAANATLPPARFVRSLADYVGGFADMGGVEFYPRLGLRLAEGEGGAPVVSMAFPDTLAALAGFQPGDRIVDLNGATHRTLSDLEWALTRIEWGQLLGFLIKRGDASLEIAVLLYPRVDLTERTTAPGFTLQAAAPYDPGARDPVAVDDGTASRPRSTLVSQDGVASRVEVWTSDVLSEVHELDGEGRAVRSLYRSVLQDGAVEVRYRRGDDGTVTGATRLDRTGTALGE
jgi:uncharacterized iron-regulated protein